MQTFILHEDMEISAGRLDSRRCFKQAVECKQIYLAINKESAGWQNHPAVLQWKNATQELLSYGWICLADCINYKAYKLQSWYAQYLVQPLAFEFPPRLHKLIPYHQSLMLRKDYHYYKTIFPGIQSTGWARYLDENDRVFHIKFGKKIYDPRLLKAFCLACLISRAISTTNCKTL